MRPGILNPLFTEVEALKGVGPQVAKLLKKLGISRVVDLLYHLPTGSIERIQAPAANAALLGRNVILELTPFDSRENRSGRGPTRIFASDSDGNTISLVYFNNPGWAKRQLPKGEKRIVSGKLEQYGDEWQIIHPEVAEPGKGPAAADPRTGLSADRGAHQPPSRRVGSRSARTRTRAPRMDRAEPPQPRGVAGLARILGAGAPGAGKRTPAPRL